MKKEEKDQKIIQKQKTKIITNRQLAFLRFVIYSSIAAIIIPAIWAAISIIKKASFANEEQATLTLVYILGSGWFFLIPLLVPVFYARREMWNKLKVFGRKSRVGIFRFIWADANEYEVVLKLKGNTMELDEEKIIVNPRKATMRDGVKIFTYVASNALAHDYMQDTKVTLKQMAAELSKKKTDELHDIFSDPIRVDAKYFNETFLAAQQTNPDILKKIIAFLTSKNILVMLGAIAIAAAAAAFFSLQATNILNTIPVCNPIQINV